MNYCLTPYSIISFLFGSQLSLDCTVILSSFDVFPDLSVGEYLTIFAWTSLLEAPFYLGLSFFGIKFKRALSLLFLANAATHPAITFLFPFILQSVPVTVAVSSLSKEVFAIVVEIIITKKYIGLSWKKAILVAGLANIFSWWVGCYIG